MKFLQCYTSKYCAFSGRANRAEFWSFVFSYTIIAVALVMINKMMGWQHIPMNLAGTYLGYPYLLFAIYSFIPFLAVSVRRLHDRDMSGWMLLLGLIPLIGGIILIIFYLMAGTPGSNRFDGSEHIDSE